MASKIKSIIQYLLILAVTFLLLWLSLRGIQTGNDQNKTDLLWQTWKQSNKFYLLLMAVVAIASHWLRAVRWKMLIDHTGNPVKSRSSFLSLMIGYLVNLGIPRGGEISRSYYLYKLEKTPIETSFGTVVAERMVDMVCLLLLLVVSFFAEWTKLMAFFEELGIGKSSQTLTIPIWLWVVLAIAAITGAGLFFFRKNEKLRKVIRGFNSGLMAIVQLEGKGLFIFYSLVIWVLYFLMTYSVMLAFDETADLGFGAVLILFAIGAIAMTLPLPGGLGSYHTLMPLGLVMIYHLPKTDATAFVFVFHAWQTLVMIIGGVISLIWTYAILRMRALP